MTDGNKAMTRVEMLKAYLSTATTEDELSKLIHDVSRLLSGGHSVGKSILSQSEFVTPEIRQGSKKKSIRVPRGTQKVAVSALEYFRKRTKTLALVHDIRDRQRSPLLPTEDERACSVLRRRMQASRKRFRHFPDTDEWELWAWKPHVAVVTSEVEDEPVE